MKPTTARARSPHLPALIVVAFMVLVVWAQFSFSTQRSTPPVQSFTPEHVWMLGMVDNIVARDALKYALIALVASYLVAARLWTLPKLREGLSLSPRGEQVLSALSPQWMGFFLLAATVRPDFLWRLLITLPHIDRDIQVAATALLAAAGLIYGSRVLTQIWFKTLIYGATAAALIAFSVPGFLHVPAIPPAVQIMVEWHYSVTIAQADRLAQGLRLGTNVDLHYGLLSSLALASWERHFGLLDFAGHLRVVQISQVLFLLLGTGACYLWRPRNALFLLGAVLFFGVWASSSGMAVLLPNQSGWRSLGFPLGVLALLFTRKSKSFRHTAFLLGCASQFLLLFNPETAICLIFGFCLFLISRHSPRQTWKELPAGLGIFLLGMATVGLAVIFGFWMGLGYWPPLEIIFGTAWLGQFLAGYGSMSLGFDPLATLMFLHCAYNAALLGLRWWRKSSGLNWDDGVRIALSATILLWSAYYVNRPDPWNLWTYCFLYAFLIADFLAPARLVRLRRAGWKAFGDFGVIALTLIVLPALVSSMSAFPRNSIPGVSVPTSAVSGVQISAPVAQLIHEKADFLKTQSQDTLFFSIHSYSVSLLAQRIPALHLQDAFIETVRPVDMDRLVTEVQTLHPSTLLFDSYRGRDTPDPFSSSFYGRLRTRVTFGYRLEREVSGWEVWRRV